MSHQHKEELMTRIQESIKNRSVPRKEKEIEQVYRLYIRNQDLIKKSLEVHHGNAVPESAVGGTIEWLEKVAKFVPITSDKELDELIEVMIILAHQRVKLNELYDEPGLDLMKRVREGMIRYMIVLSELRARQKEYLEYWFTDEYWISEWSRILLGLAPERTMEKYGFTDIKARDFLFLLELELAAADSASNLKNPMVRLQPLANKEAFLIIPTEAAAEKYKFQINRILSDDTVTFTEWVYDTLYRLELPKYL
ncbi:MAG: hypothetical protein ACFFFH_16240 [Candidatus Thorarchaeota archaeon]